MLLITKLKYDIMIWSLVRLLAPSNIIFDNLYAYTVRMAAAKHTIAADIV